MPRWRRQWNRKRSNSNNGTTVELDEEVVVEGEEEDDWILQVGDVGEVEEEEVEGDVILEDRILTTTEPRKVGE